MTERKLATKWGKEKKASSSVAVTLKVAHFFSSRISDASEVADVGADADKQLAYCTLYRLFIVNADKAERC